MESIGYVHAPLLMALYDIKYTDIPEFYDESKLVQVESVLREHGFVEKVVESFQQVNFEVSPNAPSEQMVSMQKPTASGKTKQRWIFLNLDRTVSLYFAEGSLVLKTTNYSTHEQYLELLIKVLTDIANVFPSLMKGALLQIGTRFLNLIIPKEDKSLIDYVLPSWLPNSVSLPAGIESNPGVHNRLILNYETSLGNLRVESNQFSPKAGMNKQIIPDELMDNPEVSLSIAGRPWWNDQLSSNVSYLVLDFDLIKIYREIFDINAISGYINEMRSITKPAFEGCITDTARTDWVIK
ncbi:TIGR04255 family protein [Vibrio sinaloensis]|uniref:TIGR04255 family protein n=1 Tax=Photobacterium sp. (strain ATCC 43367) TaxID=379097 RepID=UPI0035EE6962